MSSTGAGEARVGFPWGITRYQWLVFFVVWAGWSLDAADFGYDLLRMSVNARTVSLDDPTIAVVEPGIDHFDDSVLLVFLNAFPTCLAG